MSHENKNYLIAALTAFALALLITAFYQKSVIKAFTSELKQEITSLENEKTRLSEPESMLETSRFNLPSNYPKDREIVIPKDATLVGTSNNDGYITMSMNIVCVDSGGVEIVESWDAKPLEKGFEILPFANTKCVKSTVKPAA